MNILFITHQFPHPLDVGSKIRAFNLLKAYSRKHKVTLVSFYREDSELKYVPELKEYCEDIYTISTKSCVFNQEKNSNRFSRLFHSMFSKIPNSISKYRSGEAINLITKLAQNNYGLLHIERVYSFENIKNIINSKKRTFKSVLDIDDYESKKLKRELDLTRFSLRKILGIIEYHKWKSFEKNMFREFDLGLVCSVLDKKVLEENGTKTLVVPNGVNNNGESISSDKKNGADILYLGAMDYEPNNDAVIYFYKEIFPFIKKSLPGARFIIAGRNPFDGVSRLNNGKDVIVTGYVSDVNATIDNCSLFVTPIRIGGGTRIKILEAMSRGKAVVSTSIGCEGIDVTDQKNIAIADTSGEFALKCIELLKDHSKRRELGENGKKLVSEKYMWDSIGEGFMVGIDSLLSANYIKEECLCQK